ncbi:hypothetical protein GCM10007216_12210 [Thalassobacillus devorans]|uniref:Spo0E like sporulation regulatory protein n=1 Tax=Thalassobacillus devorans TaxID=279813 RepID=A0ABQ1NUD9_9BACI|nr:aspartyl-phosphate phosphatase Spo0E family protein [Thalassobacillus devorans]NIK28838.1 hypothetical protein [Thalassobacillus devorans]GGC83160.1 hypothetical protein GCM10007216_12210 [Thalassobacillus devorans]
MLGLAELEFEIEKLRQKMYLLYKDNPSDPQLVSVSQALDELLNRWQYINHEM